MRWSAISLITLMLLAGCSRASDSPGERREASAENRGSEPADVALTAAPNVAFRYDYRFAMPSSAIGGVQEKHARMCEALGAARCRITGLRYFADRDGATDGSLNLMLAPELARAFGRDAAATVTTAGGRVESIDVSGTDKSAALDDGEATRRDLTADIAALEREQARPGLRSADRTTILARIADLKTQQRAARSAVSEAKASVATTPLAIAYRAERGLFDIRVGETARHALAIAAWLLNALLAILIVLSAVAVPLLLVALAGRLLFERGRRLWSPTEPAGQSGDV